MLRERLRLFGTYVLVGLLLASAALKLHAAISRGTSDRLIEVLAASWELTLALWLLSGRHDVAARILTLLTFSAFINVALIRALDGWATCSCMGVVAITPWVAFTIHALVIGIVVAARLPMPHGGSTSRRRLAMVLAPLAGGCTSIAIMQFFNWWSAPARPALSPADKALVAEINAGLRDQYERCPAVTGIIQRVAKNLTVEAMRRDEIRDAKGRIDSVSIVAPETQHLSKFAVRNDDIWKETVEAGHVVSIESYFQSRYIDFHPRIHQGWTHNRPTGGYLSEPLDPRCVGLRRPLNALYTWDNELDIKSIESIERYAEENDRGIRVSVIDSDDYHSTVWFSAVFGYHPRAARLVDPGHSIQTDVHWEYSRIGEQAVWFPSRVHATNTPIRQGKLSGEAVGAVDWLFSALDTKAQPSDATFDVVLPKKCSVLDLTGRTVPRFVRSESAMTTFLADGELNPAADKTIPLVLLNSLLAAVIVTSRRRLFT